MRFKTELPISIRLILTALVSLQATSIGAPRAQEAENPIFGEVIQVNVVNIEVVVTDKKGVPIEGLTEADFTLFEDGRPVDISHFSFIGGPPPSEAPTRAELPAASQPPQVPAEQTAIAPREQVWLAIFVDNLHTRAHERNRALGQLQEFVLDQLAADDQVLVATYDRALSIEQEFTRHRAEIVEALSEIEKTTTDADWHDRERRRLVQQVQLVSTAKDAVEMIRPWAGQVRNELWGSLLAVGEMVDIMAGLPGRKFVLHVSSGLPANPGAVPFKAVEYRWPSALGIHELMLFDQTEEFRKLAARASASGVVLHTFDAAGVRAPRSGSVEGEGNTVPAMSANNDLDERINVQMPLRMLADITGGRAILNRNDALPALGQLAGELHTYYSLGFEPSRPGDDRYHRLKVRVRRKGARLRYREGYRDKTPGTRMAEQLRAVLAHGVDENPLGVGMVVQPASDAGPGRFQIPLQVTVPIRNLAREPGEEGFNCRFRLYLAVMDERGEMSDVLEVPASFTIASGEVESALAAQWRMSRQLKMRGGRQRLAVAVRDEVSHVSAFTSRALELGVER